MTPSSFPLRRPAGMFLLILLFLSSGIALSRRTTPHVNREKMENRLGPDSVLHIYGDVKPHEYVGRADIRRIVAVEGLRSLSIGEYAFWNCPNLEEADLSAYAGDAALGEAVFKECGRLRKVSLPRRQKMLPKYFCAWDSLLCDIYLPASVEDIRSHAFAYCGALDSVAIPPRVSHVGNNAFSRCTALRSVRIPDSVKELESYAFSDCTSLSFARLPANSSLLGELIFSGCSNLRVVEEPSARPPSFDCSSFLFEPEDTAMLRRVSVAVPVNALNLYLTSEDWKLLPSASFMPLP